MQTVTVNDKRITYVQNASCHFYWNMNLTVAARTGKEQTCNMIGLGFSNVINMYNFKDKTRIVHFYSQRKFTS